MVAMMKYCTKCHQKFQDPGYIYCPLCASTLIEIIALESGLYQVMELIPEEPVS